MEKDVQTEKEESNIYLFKDEKVVPDPVHEYTACLDGVPIVIDNG